MHLFFSLVAKLHAYFHTVARDLYELTTSRLMIVATPFDNIWLKTENTAILGS
jgi:hypothetical protein